MRTVVIDDATYATLLAVPALLVGVLGASAAAKAAEVDATEDALRHDTPIEVVIAATCHEANRQYCRSIGDFTQAPWSQAPGRQQASAISGVRAIRDGTVKTPVDSHASWMAEKLDAGWKYGPAKSEVAKTHPCLVPYVELAPEQRRKDVIFFTLATALLATA